MITTVKTAVPLGFNAQPIDVECSATAGLPALYIVGLGNKAISEARERVRASLRHSGFRLPARRIVINLAPADLPKDGTQFDLPIAIALLVLAGNLQPAEIEGWFFGGELALDGRLRPIRGALHIAEAAELAGTRRCLLPTESAEQAGQLRSVSCYGADSLTDVYRFLKGQQQLMRAEPGQVSPLIRSSNFNHVVGQEVAKRALVVAAAGHHNLLLSGPPGAGKTMLARCLPELLPAMEPHEIIATTKLHSLGTSQVQTGRPFRAPHHSIGISALIGGGSPIMPGEVSLAHHGVLFLDELAEFSSDCLESLRQPLEDRSVTIAKARSRVHFPADFMLAATCNPCPCGYLGDQTKACSCSLASIERYRQRLSGPLLDRIDIHLSLPRVPTKQLLGAITSTKSLEAAREQVAQARAAQRRRYGNASALNANAGNRQVSETMSISPAALALIAQAAQRFQLTARGHFKTIRVARTIADMAGSPAVLPAHMSEALQYRNI